MSDRLPDFLVKTHENTYAPVGKQIHIPILEKGIRVFSGLVKRSYTQWEASRKDGFLQRVNPKVKVVLTVLFLILISVNNALPGQVLLIILIIFLSWCSRVGVLRILKPALLSAVVFGFLVPLPNIFYFNNRNIPSIAIRNMILLFLRIANSVGFSSLLLHTTSFQDLMKSLRNFRVPPSFIDITTLAYQYILSFARVLEAAYLAKKSRLVKSVTSEQSRKWAVDRLVYLFEKCQDRYQNIFRAMCSRGFSTQFEKGDLMSILPVSVKPMNAIKEIVYDVKNLHYNYNLNIPALSGVDLEIRQGDRLALIGSNGSGKSTLLQILDGLIFPTGGEVYFHHHRVTEEALKELGFLRYFRERVGFVFQDSDVQLFCPTVLDELMYGPLQLSLIQEEAEHRARDVLKMLSMESVADRPTYMLSGGEKKKVAIGSVLTMNPEVLLLDEPTHGLDPKTTAFLMDLLLKLNEAGKTIVIASHDLHWITRMNMSVAVLSEDHRIEKVGSCAEVLSY